MGRNRGRKDRKEGERKGREGRTKKGAEVKARKTGWDGLRSRGVSMEKKRRYTGAGPARHSHARRCAASG
eukprot:5113820-Pyramimonas_sp.AAC.1